MYYYDMMGYGFPFMSIFWLIIIGLIVWIIIKLTRQPMQSNASQMQTVDSIDILKRRYANGEITKKEYDQIKKELED